MESSTGGKDYPAKKKKKETTVTNMRRMTESERLSDVPKTGELIYCHETRKIYCGDGRTFGGNEITQNGDPVRNYPPPMMIPYRYLPATNAQLKDELKISCIRSIPYYILFLLLIIWELLKYYHIILVP